jgi:negative regulator of flagellin synthesis FlgM
MEPLGVISMKINDSQRIGAINPYNKNNENRAANAAGKKDRPKDQVEISSEAKELLGSLSEVRTEKQTRRIEELRNSIDAGTYHVDSRKLAEKLFPFLK